MLQFAKDASVMFARYDGEYGVCLLGPDARVAFRDSMCGKWPLTIHLTCGSSVTYTGIEDVPLIDVPCSCGDPTHWFLRYEGVV